MYIESVMGSRPIGMGDLSFIFDQFWSMGNLQLCPDYGLYQTSSVFYFILLYFSFLESYQISDSIPSAKKI